MTGKVVWRERCRRGRGWSHAVPGNEAGNGTSSTGYRAVRIENKLLFSHHIAWFLHYGEWPLMQVDHVNCDRKDNRIENLRLASLSQQGYNTTLRSNNTSGVKGVYFDRTRRKWSAEIKYNKTKKFLGYFDCIGDAAKARQAAADRYHQEFARQA